MKIRQIALLGIIISVCISCDMAVENLKDRTTKILEEKKVEIDSTLNKKINKTLNEADSTLNKKLNKTINKVDTLLNY